MFRKGATKHCCWGLCKSDSRYPEKLPKGTFFIPFPKPGKIRDGMTQWERREAEKKTERAVRWQHLCGRSDFDGVDQIKVHTYICSLHFVGGKGPRKWKDQPLSAVPKRGAPKLQRRRRKRKVPSPDEGETSLDQQNPDDRTVQAGRSHNEKRPRKRRRSISFPAGEGVEIEWPDYDDLRVQHIQLQVGYTDLQAKVDSMLAKNERLRENLLLLLPRFSYASIKGDDAQLTFHSGLHSLVFDWLVTQIAGQFERVHPELNAHDHLLMVLMKLKLGLCDKDLSYRFRIQERSVTAICQSWIPALAFVLKPLVAWPTADTVAKLRPSVLESTFCKCRGIVDWLKFAVAKTSEKKNAQENVAVRYFVGVTPAGAVSFLSLGYTLDVTKQQIMKESAFLHLVDEEDEVLSCKQIDIGSELASRGATLRTPDYVNGKLAPKSDLEKTFWTHAKKVIGWWKDFTMLKKVIPETYESVVDHVLIICAALTNLNLSFQK